MYTQYPKKMLIMCIYDILKEYSDENHRLKQQDIINLLKREYNMSCDRKSVKTNIINLIDYGCQIECEETIRRNKNGEEETISTNWYMIHDFDDAELKLFINSVLFSKMIPTSQAKALIQKIKNLSSKYFDAKIKHVVNLPALNHTSNKQIIYNLEIIDDSIDNLKKISFKYNTYGTDKKLHPKKDRKTDYQEDKIYIVNPYTTVANNGKYYLIANCDDYDNVAHFRVDRMTNIEMLTERRKPQKQVKGLENGINLPKHMAEHVFMFSDETESIKFKVGKGIMSEVVDAFGKDFTVVSEDDESAIIRVQCSHMAMKCWAMQFGEYVEILEPKKLRDDVREVVKGMMKMYGK